jgi:hypothetical protein
MFKKIYDSTTPPLESECNMFIKEITKKHIDYNQTNVLNAAEIMDKIIKQI